MIFISRKNLLGYQKIGSGKYGTVYQIDDNIAYKIYHPYIINKEGYKIMNPALQNSLRRLKLLIKKQKKIHHSDLVKDYVIIDSYFGGVCIPYYDGSTLENLSNVPYELKRDISKQLVRNNKELKKHHIYPLDYHLGNVMFSNGEAKIIDLDDPLTRIERIPSLLFSLISMGRLNDTIQDFFQEYHYHCYPKEILKLLEHKNVKYSNKENWLTTYLNDKEKLQNYLLIDEFTNIETIKSLTRDNQYRILLIINPTMHTNKYLVNKLLNLRANGIYIYDLINPQDIETYFENFPVKEKVLIKENQSHLLTN